MNEPPAASATPFQSKYWATQLALRSAGGSINQLLGAISNARVDLNPHQKHWAASGASDRLAAQRREVTANQKGENEEA
jgi:hypothetical protein